MFRKSSINHSPWYSRIRFYPTLLLFVLVGSILCWMNIPRILSPLGDVEAESPTTFPPCKSASHSVIAQPKVSPLSITVLGDSIVGGLYDELDQNGFVGRLRERFPYFTIHQIGQAGITTPGMKRYLMSELYSPKSSGVQRAFLDSDLLILSLGINDFWNDGAPLSTARALRQIVAIIQRFREENNLPPISVVTATLLQGKREHSYWVRSVNSVIYNQHRLGFGVLLPYDLVPLSGFSADRVHPNSLGYERITLIASAFLRECYAVPRVNHQADLFQCVEPITIREVSEESKLQKEEHETALQIRREMRTKKGVTKNKPSPD